MTGDLSGGDKGGDISSIPSGPQMTVRNPNLSPRRSSILSKKQSILQNSTASGAADQISFRPISITCFGDFILAQLMSSSRTNYLALWGPECHQCEAQELTVESAKVFF